MRPVVTTSYRLPRHNKEQLTQSMLFNGGGIKEPLVKIVEASQKLITKMLFFHRFEQEGVSQ